MWDLLCVQVANYLDGGPLMWMMPLQLHVNKKHDDDDAKWMLQMVHFYSPVWKKGGGLYRIWVVYHSIGLSFRHIFVSAQYLENKFWYIFTIFYMHSYWQDLAWDCYTSFFAYLYQSFDPWFTPKLEFPNFGVQVFLSLKAVFVIANTVDLMKCHILWHFIKVYTVCISSFYS